ncbi:MAG: hypothetical protein LBR05_01790 [Azoarcus sp.]|nr:hypothetical protein [Azoarcus sp.]
MPYLQSLLGIVFTVALVWLMSENRRAVTPRLVLGGLAFQFALAALLLKLPWIAAQAGTLNNLVTALEEATLAGTSFVFGYVGGGPAPFEVTNANAMVIFAFRGLMLIPVLAALSALLFHWGVLPFIVRCFSRLLQWLFGIDGVLGFGVAANVFMGMVESPLVIRHYLRDMPRADFFALMVAGMSTIAGTVFVLYATILRPVFGVDATLHLLTASLISCPAAIMLARIAVPAASKSAANDAVVPEKLYQGSLDAIATGTMEGMRLFLNVVFILVVVVALVHLGNAALGLLPNVGDAPLTLQRLLGWIFTPLAWLLGIPWSECAHAGSLLGTKLVLNELVAYLDFSALPPETFALRSRVIVTYALCGFANLGSLGIMIAGLNTLVPERRDEVFALGGKAVLLGFLAACMTGAVAGFLY